MSTVDALEKARPHCAETNRRAGDTPRLGLIKGSAWPFPLLFSYSLMSCSTVHLPTISCHCRCVLPQYSLSPLANRHGPEIQPEKEYDDNGERTGLGGKTVDADALPRDIVNEEMVAKLRGQLAGKHNEHGETMLKPMFVQPSEDDVTSSCASSRWDWCRRSRSSLLP